MPGRGLRGARAARAASAGTSGGPFIGHKEPGPPEFPLPALPALPARGRCSRLEAPGRSVHPDPTSRAAWPLRRDGSGLRQPHPGEETGNFLGSGSVGFSGWCPARCRWRCSAPGVTPGMAPGAIPESRGYSRLLGWLLGQFPAQPQALQPLPWHPRGQSPFLIGIPAALPFPPPPRAVL